MEGLADIIILTAKPSYTAEELAHLLIAHLEDVGRQCISLLSVRTDTEDISEISYFHCSLEFMIAVFLNALKDVLSPESVDEVRQAILHSIARDFAQKAETEERVMH